MNYDNSDAYVYFTYDQILTYRTHHSFCWKLWWWCQGI